MTDTPLRIHRLVLVFWTMLFLMVCARQLQQGLGIRQWLWALFFSLPLLTCASGLWRGKRYTHKWATLCVLPYFIVGITEGVANGAVRAWSLTLLGMSLLWFFSLVAYLRVTNDQQQAINNSR